MSNASKNARDKVRRFIRFFLGLKKPRLFFHQTLTFATPMLDAKAARARLKMLLARKGFPAVLFVQERNKSDGIHFHLLLYFYAEHGLPFAPTKMFDGVAAQIFAAWNDLNGGVLSKRANKMTEHTPDFETVFYLTLETRDSGTRAKGATNWWGTRNAKLFIRNPTPPSKEAVQEWMAKVYPRTPRPLGLRYSARQRARLERASREVSI